jgi:hypothetical protein
LTLRSLKGLKQTGSANLSAKLLNFGETSQHCSHSQNVSSRSKNLRLHQVDPVFGALASSIGVFGPVHLRRTYARGVTGLGAFGFAPPPGDPAPSGKIFEQRHWQNSRDKL